MFCLAWITDPHLNFLQFVGASRMFGEYLANEVKCDALVITGDIAEKDSFKECLQGLSDGLGKPIHFILGNHDFYRGSVKSTFKEAESIPGWLTKEGAIELTPETALVGNEGWYDCLIGNPHAGFGMSDWELIKEFRAAERKGREALIDLSRELSIAAVKAHRPVLEEALSRYQTVIMATHYPPFEGACWHEGRKSGPSWLPWFTSKMMGDMLVEVADNHRDRNILVLCGHTHSPGKFHPMKNLQVLTGRAVYGAPDLAGFLRINGSHVKVEMKSAKGWDIFKAFK